MSEVDFGYGCLCDPLEKQANKQGFTLGKNSETFEQIRKAINTCMFHVATDTQVSAMTKKLHAKVIKSLKSVR